MMSRRALAVGLLVATISLSLLLASAAQAWQRPAQVVSPSAATPLPPYIGWTVAADGALFVLDARHVVWRLDPQTLAPIQRSAALVTGLTDRPAYLAATSDQLWVGSAALARTVVLARADLSEQGAIDPFGPMTAAPDDFLFITDGEALWRYDATDLAAPAVTLLEPWTPAQFQGDRPQRLAVDPVQRRLYVTVYNLYGSPPHNPETLYAYDLDTLERERLVQSNGTFSTPASAAEAGLLAVGFAAKNGPLGSWLGLWRGQEQVARLPHLAGEPVLDAEGEWLYLINDEALWVLRVDDLALAAALPWFGSRPSGLQLSADGEMLYLFGSMWLTALSTAELHASGLPFLITLPVNPAGRPAMMRFASPTVAEDGVMFAVRHQPLGPDPFGFLRSTDSGRTWAPKATFAYPNYTPVDALSLSPDFAVDGTVVASAVYTSTLFRSTDRGVNWQSWQAPLAYTATGGESRHIMVLDGPGLEPRAVTVGPGDDENPAWSPAWTRLAFQSNRDGNWEIYTVRAGCNGEEEGEEECDLRRLTDHPSDDLLPAWSPDGRRIAFVSTRDGNPEIYVMDVDGGNVSRMTDHPAGDWRPVWLPDSRRLLFTTGREGSNDLYVVTVPDGTSMLPPEARPLIATPADERDPAISERSGLLFVSDYSGTPGIYGVAPYDLWDDRSAGLELRAVQPYPLGTDTRMLPGEHPAWYERGVTSNVLFAGESSGVYRVLRVGSLYSEEPEVLAEEALFVGHPAGGPVFWHGMPLWPP